MESVFKYELSEIEVEDIKQFCNSVAYCSIEQYLGWTQVFYKPKTCYFYLYDESGIRSFCQIEEKFKSAHIFLGPVCCDKEIMVTSLNEIIHYYKNRNYYYLGVQMYYKSGFDTELIEYTLNNKYSIKYIFDSENTQTSIEIDLEKSDDEIWNLYKSEHRGCIRKALKAGLTVDIVKNPSELDCFIKICVKMCKTRNIPEDCLPPNIVYDIFNYLNFNKKGQILFVKDKDGIMLGGIITIYQGNSVRLYKGASDPDRRDLPISHLLINEIVQRAKKANFKYLDLWGYNHFVDKNHQVYNINKFKRGFGGYCTFFAKKMNISLIPGGYYIYIFLLGIKKLIIKLNLNTNKL
jgi:hypothetical protein